MRARKLVARGLIGVVTLAALAVGITTASATTPDSVFPTGPLSGGKDQGNVTLMASTIGSFTEVGFSISKSAKGTPVILMLETFTPDSYGANNANWSYSWDTSQVPNGKYYVRAIGRHADDSVVSATTSTVVIVENPVFKLSPAIVKNGKNMVLHLQYAPPHPGGTAIAVARQCTGTAPVTASNWANRCDASTEKASAPYKNLSLSVKLPSHKIITDPSTGNPVDCSMVFCSAAISTNGLVMSGVVSIKP